MRKMTKATLLSAGLAWSLCSAASAQDAPQEEGAVELSAELNTPKQAPTGGANAHPLRLYGGLRFDVGGSFVDVDDNNADVDAKGAIGLQLGVDYVLMDYFAIGGETRLGWVKADGAEDRTMLWDLVVKPRGRYVFDNLPLEAYGALPVGLSVANAPDSASTPFVDVSGGAGATLGLMFGANYFFTENMGVNAEMGWMWHWVHLEFEPVTGGATEAKLRLGQWQLLGVNFIYAL